MRHSFREHSAGHRGQLGSGVGADRQRADPTGWSADYTLVGLVGTGDLLADLAARLPVPLLDDLLAVPAATAVAVGSGTPEQRRRTVDVMAERRLAPATLIHADVTIGPWVDLGPGCTLSPGVRVTGNVRVGAFCQLHTGSVVSHDNTLGEFVTLSPSVTLCGGVTVGDRAQVFAGATVLPGVTIGPDATVGAGAVVNRDVESGTTVVGVPAKVLSSTANPGSER